MAQVLLATLAGVAAVLGVLYVLWKPRWAVVLIIVLFPFEQLLATYIPQLLARRWLFNIMVGVVALLAVVLRFFRREPLASGFKNPVTYLVATLYALAAVGLLYTPSRGEAVAYMRFGLSYFGLYLVLMPLLVQDIYDFRRLLTGIMLAGTVIAALILLSPQTTYYAGRLFVELATDADAGGRANPLATAELGGLIALIAVLIRYERAGFLLNLLRAAALVLGLGLAIGSGSRGQVLAAVTAGVLFYPIARKVANPRQFFLGAVGFAVLALGIYLTFKLFIGEQNRERWAVYAMIQDAAGRFDRIWLLLGPYMSSPGHWLFGLGTNAFSSFDPAREGTYVHNLAAEVLGEQGLVGAVVLGASMYFTYRYGYRLWACYRDDPLMRSTAAILAGICAYALILSLKQGSFIADPAPFYWWLVLAKIARHEQSMTAGWSAEPAGEPVVERSGVVEVAGVGFAEPEDEAMAR